MVRNGKGSGPTQRLARDSPLPGRKPPPVHTIIRLSPRPALKRLSLTKNKKQVRIGKMRSLSLEKSPYFHYLGEDENFRRWVEALERGSINASSVYFRKSCYAFEELGMTEDESPRSIHLASCDASQT